jgi:hypothetical protein
MQTSAATNGRTRCPRRRQAYAVPVGSSNAALNAVADASATPSLSSSLRGRGKARGTLSVACSYHRCTSRVVLADHKLTGANAAKRSKKAKASRCWALAEVPAVHSVRRRGLRRLGLGESAAHSHCCASAEEVQRPSDRDVQHRRGCVCSSRHSAVECSSIRSPALCGSTESRCADRRHDARAASLSARGAVPGGGGGGGVGRFRRRCSGENKRWVRSLGDGDSRDSSSMPMKPRLIAVGSSTECGFGVGAHQCSHPQTVGPHLRRDQIET